MFRADLFEDCVARLEAVGDDVAPRGRAEGHRIQAIVHTDGGVADVGVEVEGGGVEGGRAGVVPPL